MCYRTHSKGQGGFRPIALMSGCMRVCESVLSPQTQQMRGATGRSITTGARQGAESAVWRRSVRAEAAVRGGGHWATFMTGYTKLYELIHHGALAICALAQGVPAWRLRVELRLFRSPRVLVLCGVAPALLWPCRGVPAGASCVYALAKALLRPALTEAASPP